MSCLCPALRRRTILTRCILVSPLGDDVLPAEGLAMLFGQCPVFLTMDSSPVSYVFQVDVRVDTEGLCAEERYSHFELFEAVIDASTYNREHRVEEVPENLEALARRRSSAMSRRRSSTLARRRRSSDAFNTRSLEGQTGGMALSVPIIFGMV
jgi:hypothetical protein